MSHVDAKPIGYIETQVSWVGLKPHREMHEIISDAQAKALKENPGYVVYGARMELVTDGAGVPHYNVYLGFKPARAAAPPLNPRNLNEAPPPPVGSMPLEDLPPLGMKEMKFGL